MKVDGREVWWLLLLCVTSHHLVLPCIEVMVVVIVRLISPSCSPSCSIVSQWWLLLAVVVVAARCGNRVRTSGGSQFLTVVCLCVCVGFVFIQLTNLIQSHTLHMSNMQHMSFFLRAGCGLAQFNSQTALQVDRFYGLGYFGLVG